MAQILITDLTENRTDGTGVFDQLMSAANDHIREEYKKTRIQGSDYSKVYLGGLQTTMQQAIAFLLQKQEADKKAELIDEQINTERLNSDLVAAQIAKIATEISLMEKQELKLDQDILVAIQEVLFSKAKVSQMENQALLTEAQTAKTLKDVEIASEQVKVMEQEVLFSIAKVDQMEEEALLTRAKVELTTQQVQNAIAETLVTTRQADKIEQDILVAEQQVLNMEQQVLKTAAEVVVLQVQDDLILQDVALRTQQVLSEVQNTALVGSRKALTDQELINLVSEELKIDAETAVVTKQGSKIDQEVLNLQQQVINMGADKLKTDAETALIGQQEANLVIQGTLITAQVGKTTAEKVLLQAKSDTEQASVSNSFTSSVTGLTINSTTTGLVDGLVLKQKTLYERQADGFLRDAEQKLAKIMVDAWNVRKSANPDTTNADLVNQLGDSSIGEVIKDAMAGIGVTPPV